MQKHVAKDCPKTQWDFSQFRREVKPFGKEIPKISIGPNHQKANNTNEQHTDVHSNINHDKLNHSIALMIAEF